MIGFEAGSRVPRSLVAGLVALMLAGCASAGHTPTEQAAQSASTWHEDALAIAAGADSQARAAAIEARLAALHIPVARQPFTSRTGPGVNFIAALPDTRDLPVLLIGAHYDRVAVGQGAVDNASGCATVLALGAAFVRSPLEHHRVVLAFWDQEELGLLGSKAYVEAIAAGAEPGAVLYLNFDVFGYGDTIWGMVPDDDAVFGAAMKQAGTASGVATSIGLMYPPTDHLAFLAGKQRAVSLSLLGGDEIPGILEGFAGRRPAVMPKVLELIHTAGDVPAELDPGAVERAVPVVIDGLRRWDTKVEVPSGAVPAIGRSRGRGASSVRSRSVHASSMMIMPV